MRAALAGIVPTIAAWMTLQFTLGNVGLQRSVAIGPATLLENPVAIGSTLVVAGVAAHLVARTGSGTVSWAGPVAASILTTVVGSAVLAPLAVGELQIGHAPVVSLVISLFGMVFVAIGVGTASVRRAAGRVTPSG